MFFIKLIGILPIDPSGFKISTIDLFNVVDGGGTMAYDLITSPNLQFEIGFNPSCISTRSPT